MKPKHSLIFNSLKQLVQYGNNLHSIDIALGIIKDLEMI